MKAIEPRHTRLPDPGGPKRHEYLTRSRSHLMIYRTRWLQRWWLPYGPTCRFGLVGREAALLVVEGSGRGGGGACACG